ncbi:MAG: hypothetical protein CFE25_05695 [Chitinophagaceae bacterium BSSC1]|nr:MAG: hypothetical protein CFE25_05695 [Chitinophagaceae bacterium BSSC1]
MPKNLASEVTKENVIKALEKIMVEKPELNKSTIHDLIYKDQKFPPKEVVREAARIQNIPEWWTYNLSGGDVTNKPLIKMGFEIVTKKEEIDNEILFIELIKRIGYDSCSIYFDCIDQVSEILDWKTSDERFTFGTSTNSRLTITIGQRYCLALIPNEEMPWQFISKSPLHEKGSVQVGEYKDEPHAFYYRCSDPTEMVNGIEGISDACLIEMNRTEKSGFNKSNNKIFERSVFDKVYRAQIFNKAFSLNNSIMNDTSKISLNTILYGPPGTGKTYNCINKALEIIGVETKDISRNEVKELFDKRISEGQIVFTTFHQSMNYEDFIEGIKPKTIDNKIVYEIEDGIFKQLCNKARFVSGNFLEVLERFKKDISEEDGKSPLTIKATGTTFDIVYRGTNVFYVQPHNSIKQNPWYPVNINHIKIAFETEKFEGLYNPTYIREVIKYLEKNYGLKKETSNIESKPYVLIIDEINRGNVSQIFGELITLIEDDKREGASESISLVLPYSKEKFSVPSNVYILGTMNTADRSVEALDTALRRRFSFEEMPPRPELIEQKILKNYVDTFVKYYDLDDEEEPWATYEENFKSLLNENRGIYEKMSYDTLQKAIRNEFSEENYERVYQLFVKERISFLPADILKLLNKRIEILIDSDHQIGHSYFISIEDISDLKHTFHNKIIPLLQEYFYGDYGKIGCVIGTGFFDIIEDEIKINPFPKFGNYDVDSFLEKPKYKLKNIGKMTNDEFYIAINLLLKVE